MYFAHCPFYLCNNCDITSLTVFIIPTLLTFPVEETGAPGENPRLSAERWLTPFTWIRSENRTHDLRGERRRGVYSSINFDSFPPPPPSFQIWFFSPYLYYISLKGLYLIVILWYSIFGVLWPMGANGGIDKHRQNEIKMKEMKFWRKFQCFKFRSKSGKN
jgi:hypothetical protein